MDQIITKTNEKEDLNHGWTTDLNSSLWLWSGMLGKNVHFRSNYFLNFFNKVLLNTIQDHQVFCFVPMIKYHSNTLKIDDKGIFSDRTSNESLASSKNLHIDEGYFPSNAGTV